MIFLMQQGLCGFFYLYDGVYTMEKHLFTGKKSIDTLKKYNFSSFIGVKAGVL